MARSAVLIDREYLKHDPGYGHPERPERLDSLLELSETLDRGRFQLLAPRRAAREEIERCHSRDYIELVQSTSLVNRYALDGDTITSRDSFGVGLLAVGGFLKLLDCIAAGEFRNGFALVRPPGHHALSDRAMGFCLFNTMAVGGHYLKRHYGAERVLIVDWDVHHGNGTQDAFYRDPSALFISTHQYPYYPGTGAIEDVGEGAGAGYTVNIPLPAGCSDAEYLQVFEEIVLPVAERYEPEWLLVSAGFDAHRRDPLGGMGVTEQGFAAMASSLLRTAEKYAGGKIALLLEGGYNLTALKNSVAAVLEQMECEGKMEWEGARGDEAIQPVLRKILETQETYWSF